MRKSAMVVVAASALALGACANMTETQERTLTGTAVGTAAGLGVGLLTGRPTTYMALGAAAGTAGGFLYDHFEKKDDK